jgi:hypothetical protein
VMLLRQELVERLVTQLQSASAPPPPAPPSR